MAKDLSCGVILVNERQEIFLAHVTGASHWDIPKGGADPGEEAAPAALRELVEETGIVLSEADLTDLGIQRYTPKKDLHLFFAYLPSHRVDIKACVCTSCFRHPALEVDMPEMDDFRWVKLADIGEFCTPNMNKLLSSLPLAELQAKARV